MRKQIILSLLCLAGLQSMAQKTQYISGYVRSEYNGKDVSNAMVYVPADSVQMLTDHHGFFSFEVTARDSIRFVVERSGFEEGVHALKLADIEGPVIIEVSPILNLEFTHFDPASNTNAFVNEVQSDYIQLDQAELDHVPFVFSEPDMVKALQIRPGVEFATDGFSDMVVRGGALSQNLILVDGAPVYGIGHFLGFLSNVRSPMAQSVTMYKGAFPARYGGRLSSITSVQTNAGDGKSATVDFAVSPILANLDFGLPLGDKGSSIGFGIRRSFVDLLFNAQGLDLFYRDFNTRLKLVIDDKATLNLSYFNMKDRYGAIFTFNDSNTNIEESYKMDFYNRTISANLGYLHNKKLSANYSIYFTDYGSKLSLEERDFLAPSGSAEFSEFDVDFSAGEIGAQADYTYRKDKASLWRFGLQNKIHQYNSGSLVRTTYDGQRQQLFRESYGDTVLQRGLEMAAYFENEHKFNNKFKVNVGVRNVLYSFKGFTRYYFEPRLLGRYQINKNSSVRASYTRVNQFVHLYNTGGNTTDDFINWIPAGEELKPQGSNIFTIGYASKPGTQVQFLSEAYYKTLSNQPLFYSADVFNRSDVVANAETGTGRVLGWENSIRFIDDYSILYLSGTVMSSTRTYENLNLGEPFAFEYDRRFIAKGGFIFNAPFAVLSAHAVVATGNPFTLPSSKYRDIDGNIILSYDEINNYRATPHNRIDMKIEWFYGADGQQSIELSIYNLLSRPNVSSIYSQRDSNSTTGKHEALQLSSFTILPFITYRLRIE